MTTFLVDKLVGPRVMNWGLKMLNFGAYEADDSPMMATVMRAELDQLVVERTLIASSDIEQPFFNGLKSIEFLIMRPFDAEPSLAKPSLKEGALLTVLSVTNDLPRSLQL